MALCLCARAHCDELMVVMMLLEAASVACAALWR